MSAAAVLAPFWLANAWLPAPVAGQTLRDVNGVALAVGQTVKIVGTITALTASDPHFSGISFTPLHPNGSLIVPNATDSVDRTLGATGTKPVIYYFDPTQIIVGS